MWPKTILGLLLGLLISISLIVNLNLILPMSEPALLLLGLIVAFPAWAGLVVWSYAHPDAKSAAMSLLYVLIPSLCLNTILLLMR
ncbi:hypothetical protein ACSLBF_18530 (plasmid) [Pseudoalteromonas sp. T1lg65]|uniref:hypothetical protein n=1 Tax=Pseudoalteromonas sp. T1lg65 TaxID=2077101 RepID=UPI003F7AC905